MFFFAVATTSERKPVGAPVGSLRSAAEATEMPSSSPIMWVGRYSAMCSKVSSGSMLYSCAAAPHVFVSRT